MNDTERPSLESVRVLVVDDEPDICRGVAKLASSLGVKVRTAFSAENAIHEMELHAAHVVISDIKMKGMSGVELLERIVERWPAASVVLMTGFGTIELAVSALQKGASHFLTKPFDNDELLQVVKRLARKAAVEEQSRQKHAGISGFIAADKRMQVVMNLIDQVAATRVPVLIQGESGTGKELTARAIHTKSAVAEKPFLAVNCAALPDTLLESELFGYKRGAFTGANKDHDGIFKQAQGGSVFLDELSSMSLSFQGKLLRVLQEKVVRPLGAKADEAVDFRLITSSNRNLNELVERGEFREDLYYRLTVFTIDLPPLRERRGDIPALATHFVRMATETLIGDGAAVPEISHAAMEEISTAPWPGNVRELENTMQRAVIMCRGSRILPHHLLMRDPLLASAEESGDLLSYETAKQQALERFQRRFLERALEQTHGNITQAAELCGLTRVAVQKMMRKLGLERNAFMEE